VVVFVQIKGRLQAKLLALGYVQIGSTLAGHFGVASLLILALFLSSFTSFWNILFGTILKPP